MLRHTPVRFARGAATGLIVLAASGGAAAQTWRVADVYSSGPIPGGGPSTSLTLSAAADVRSGETGHQGQSVLLSYGCNAFILRFPRTPVLDMNERSEDVLLVGRAPLIAPNGGRPRTVRGSYAVDGQTVETNSQWAVGPGAEEFATYRGPNPQRLTNALIRGGQIEIQLQGDAGVQAYRFPLAGSARAIGEARRHCEMERRVR